jgi:hypothetical protein
LRLNSRHVALVDTPGFDDTYRPDAQIFKELAIWLAARYRAKTQVTAVIYMQPISATRMAGSALRNLTTMKKMLGVQSFPQLTLVTSMWDIINKESAESREKELIENFWQDLIIEGATVARGYGDHASALRIIETIKIEGQSLGFTIQQELVDEELPLDRTSAGAFLSHDFRTLANAQNEKLQRGYTNISISGQARVILGATHMEKGSQLTNIQNSIKELEVLFKDSTSTDLTDAASLWLAKQSEEQADQKDYSNIFLVAPKPSPKPIYQKLHNDDFRLVELSAGEGQTTVELSLKVVNLQRPPQYAALSYVVGHVDQKVKVRFRRGGEVFPIEISQNLETALRSLRQPYTDIRIWVDALSINQFDLEERAREVRRMSRIFHQAANVCIWLGPATAQVKLALDLIPEVLDFGRLEECVRDRSKRQNWIELAKLMSRPYFRRRWVVQEILLAKAATVHCDNRVLPWQDFLDATVLLRSKWTDLRENLALSDEDIVELGDVQLLGAAALIEVSRLVFRKDNNGKVLQRLLNLEMLLSLLPTFEVTELLDTVYAVIDLAKDEADTKQIKVDYGLPPEALFQEVTRLVVTSSKSLDIICRPWAPKCGVPTWVPTLAKYTFRRRASNFQYDRQQGITLVGMPHTRTYRACSDTTPDRTDTMFREAGIYRILSAKGFVVGSIEEVGQRSMNGNIPNEWMELAGWEDMTKPVPEPFWRTLVADRSDEGRTVPEWYSRACQFAFRQSIRDDIDVTMLMRTLKSTHVQQFLSRVQEVIWGRTLASLSSNEDVPSSQLALCPPDARSGDIVVILYGCSVPVVLRKVRSYYKLIGECFVYGIMEGELFNDEAVTRPTETFDLI